MPSLIKIKNGELKEIINKYPDLFDEEENDDAEFSILTLFVLREKMLGEDSFWKPYLDTIDRSYTMLDWTEEDLSHIEDLSLREEV